MCEELIFVISICVYTHTHTKYPDGFIANKSLTPIISGRMRSTFFLSYFGFRKKEQKTHLLKICKIILGNTLFLRQCPSVAQPGVR